MNTAAMADYRSSRPFRLALLLSLLLHALALCWRVSAPTALSGAAPSGEAPKKRLDIALTPSRPPVAQAVPPMPPQQARPPARQRKSLARELLAVPKALSEPRQWSRAEREAMENFLDELHPAPTPPKTGEQLARESLALARRMGREAPADETPAAAPPVGRPDARAVEPFSLQMYFDAFINKLNRSADFIKNDPAGRGLRTALVEITLNPNGTLQSYRVLRSGDQEKQIAYIKRVIDIAAPFAPFPDDIRRAMGGFSVRICIQPARAGEGGKMFLRSADDGECRDG